MRQLFVTVAADANRDDKWVETYTEGAKQYGFPAGHEDPERWARELVQHFNDTLRPGEKPRVILGVEIRNVTEDVAEKTKLEHVWEKTNLVTIEKRGQMYDTARCTRCGATSKRFGVGRHQLDPRFKNRVNCPGPSRTVKQHRDQVL